MTIDVPEKGIDVRKLRPVLAQIAKILNNFGVSITMDKSVGYPSGNLQLGDSNAVLKLNLPDHAGGAIPPWEAWGMDPLGSEDDPAWDVCFGDGTNIAEDFVTNDKTLLGGDVTVVAPDPINKFAMLVGNLNGSQTSSLSLTVGDEATPDNDGLTFSFEGKGLQLDWTTYPEIILAKDINDMTGDAYIDIAINDDGPDLKLDDGTGNYIDLNLEDEPELHIYSDDLGDTVLDANSLNLEDKPTGDTIVIDVSIPSFEITADGDTTTLSNGDLSMSSDTGSIGIGVESEDGHITIGDDAGNFLDINLPDGPQFEIYSPTDGDTVLDANSLNLTDGESGDTIVIDVSVPSIEINSDGNITTLSNGDLDLGTSGTIELGTDGSLECGDTTLSNGDLDLGTSGTIELGVDGSLECGDTTLSDGDLDLGASGTIELGSAGSLECGDTVITTGNINLGGTGTIEIGTRTYSPTQIQDCNGKKLYILADDGGWA